MTTLSASQQEQRNRLLERRQIKRMLRALSTVVTPESIAPTATKPRRPSYLRYIEYA